MNNKEITIKPIVVKEIAQKIENNCLQIPYDKQEMKDIFSKNKGDSRTQVNALNTQTGIFVGNIKKVMEDTNTFLINAAAYFKDVDEALAKEVSKV